MRRILSINPTLFTVYIASAMPMENTIEEQEDIPRDNEYLTVYDPKLQRWVHPLEKEEELDHQVLDDVARNPANNRYFLFTR